MTLSNNGKLFGIEKGQIREEQWAYWRPEEYELQGQCIMM